MENINRLDWDSNFFGCNIGKLELHESDSPDAINFVKFSEYDLVYLFSPFKIPSLQTHLVDEKLVLKKHLSFENNKESNLKVTIQEYQDSQKNRSQLRELALQSGKYSRFFIDKNFTEGSFDKLYNEWIDKSVDRTLAFLILGAYLESKLVGFITVQHINASTCRIGLISVSEEHRGQGIAKNLVLSACNICFEKGYIQMEVVTQNNNELAVNLYLKNGFKKESLTYIYHLWNN
jgi:dTDP-4-amino-4,6-dideoxy-D-galactose acyltransferase